MLIEQKKIMNDDYVVALSNTFHLYRKKIKQPPSIQGWSICLIHNSFTFMRHGDVTHVMLDHNIYYNVK